MENAICACASQKPFAECCEPFLKGSATPDTAVAMMRSRYSAFVHHEIDYLMKTVVPARRKDIDRKGIEDWARETNWSGLEIIATEKGGPSDAKGEVEFVAKFMEGKVEKRHHELATFVKMDGEWYFDDGRPPTVKPVRLAGPKIGRNDPCTCGSGKKYKKCHGQSVTA